MRRSRPILAGATSALIVAGLLATAAPASASWTLLQCVPTVRGAKICFYRDNQNNNLAQGRYINKSGIDLKTQGSFWRQSGHAAGCSQAITEAGTTSVCTRTLPNGRFYLLASTQGAGGSVRFDSTNYFRFGG